MFRGELTPWELLLTGVVTPEADGTWSLDALTGPVSSYIGAFASVRILEVPLPLGGDIPFHVDDGLFLYDLDDQMRLPGEHPVGDTTVAVVEAAANELVQEILEQYRTDVRLAAAVRLLRIEAAILATRRHDYDLDLVPLEQVEEWAESVLLTGGVEPFPRDLRRCEKVATTLAF